MKISSGKKRKVSMITSKLYNDKILVVEFLTQESLCWTMCRFQEHYESPEWKGKIFTLGQFRHWYAATYGGWTYPEDWGGFNISTSVLKPFDDGLFDPLSAQERRFMDELRKYHGVEYIIASYKGADVDAIPHEISHALWATVPAYKSECEAALAKYDLEPVKALLKTMGYHESVFLDECHAYIGESFEYLHHRNVPFSVELRRELRDIKARYK